MMLASHEALERARSRDPDPFPAGSAAEAEALQRFSHFFSQLEAKRVQALCRSTYTETIWFSDGLKVVESLDALEHYLIESARAVDDCRVQIDDINRTRDGSYLLRWTMMIRYKRFKRGQDTHSIGISHLRFTPQGRVCYHQDYWDSGSNLFEHVPLLGWAIGRIKARL